MARGSKARLKEYASKAFNKVAATRGGERCGKSTRGAKNYVCLSVAPVVGMKCGLNPINKLYACAGSSKKSPYGKRKKMTAKMYKKFRGGPRR